MGERFQPGRLIGRGRTAEVFDWGAGRALKLYYRGVPDEAVEHEAAAGRAVCAAGVPAPQVFEVVTVDGRGGIVTERVEGRSMVAQLKRRPWQVSRLGQQLAELQSAFHAVPAAGVFPPLRDRLRQRIVDDANPLPGPLKAAALGVLDRLPDGSALCHGDFHPDNVVMTARGPVILDWNDATRGHPLADAARTRLLLRIGESPGVSRLERWLTNRVRGAFCAAYTRRYLARTGVSLALIDAWALPVAAARLAEQIDEERALLLAEIARLAGLPPSQSPG